jgi:hypothetical protein
MAELVFGMAVSSTDANAGPAVYIQRTLSYSDGQGERRTVEEAELHTLRPPLVILGDPGMGKTELLDAYAKRQGFTFITARRLLRRPLAELQKDPTRVWVIDAFDEVASARGEEPVQLVLERLGALGYPPFVLSCRGVDWQSATTNTDIEDDYDVPPTQLQLNALSRSEAETALAGTLGLETARKTIADLVARGLETLFENPLTLLLIASLIKAHGQLPESRADLYREACDLLVTEENDKHRQGALNNLAKDEALNAAGAACAALILTGSEAISLEMAGSVAEGDLRAVEIATLPGASAVEAVLHSRLFRQPRGGDRMAPLHRTIAEYLGARWLAARFDTASARRIFSLVNFRGGVPASLRGLHAWLAHFNHTISEQVIETDPFGVLRYGDADGLSPPEGHAMLRGLKQLSIDTPYFRSGDWTRYSARGLAQAALADEVRALVLDPKTSYAFRSVLLDALKGSPAAALLKADLFKVVMQDGKRGLGREARISAAEILIALKDPGDDWPAVVDTLSQRVPAAARYLAVNIIITEGGSAFPPAIIARAVLGYTGRLPGQEKSTGRVEGVGPLYHLARLTPAEQIGAVLDEYIAQSPKATPKDWNAEYALNDLIATLISRRLEGTAPAPLDLLRWLRIHADMHMTGGDKRKAIRDWMRAHDDVRRAIQAHVMFVETDDDNVFARGWGLNRLDAALVPSFEDVVVLLDDPHLKPLSKESVRKRWRDVVQLGAHAEGLHEAISAKASAQAAGDAELEAFLERLRNPSPPDWEAEQRKRQAREARRRERDWAKHRADYEGRVAQVRSGELGGVFQMAMAYTGRFYELNEAAEPRERVRLWLGDDLLAAALEGFEAVLHRDDLQGSVKFAESYAEGQTWNYIFPILVGLLERVRTGRGLDGVPDDVIISGRLGMERETLGDGDENQTVRDALDAWLADHPASYETYIRLLVEPQLRKPGDTHHIYGLYQLARSEAAADLVTPLAAEWLSKFPDMPAIAEIELVDHLTRFKAWDALRAAAAARKTRGYRDDERRLLWFTVAFLTGFEPARAELDAAAVAHLRSRGGLNRADPADGGLLARAVWLVRTFRKAFPSRGRPSRTISGSENAWDASEFLHGAINAITGELSDAAVTALTALRDDVDDSYSENIRNAVSAQARARREEAFTPATLAELASVVANDRPRTMEDLRAMVLDALELLQAKARGDQFNVVERFYDAGAPLDEERCRDVVGALVQGELRHGIQLLSEARMPASKRADLAFLLEALQLPLEAKGQWNAALWTAPMGQLEKLYTTEWRAAGIGIYLVFWFGPDAPKGRKLRGPPKGQPRPTTPSELVAALVATIPEHLRSDISVVVLDLCRGPVQSPAPA